MSDLTDRLRAIDEDEMYGAPFTTQCTCREAADEIDRMQASLTARDTDLMREVQLYKMRWLGTPTRDATPASEEVTTKIHAARAALARIYPDVSHDDYWAIRDALERLQYLEATQPTLAEQGTDRGME